MASKNQMNWRELHLPVSNPGKVLYPAGKVTKAQVIQFYVHIAPWLLPHLKDRPVTLKRFPDGVHGEFFYEKDAPAFTPEWVTRFPVPRRDQSLEPIQYIIIEDVRTLAWLGNLACLELHPFLHHVPLIHRPSHVVFDLDPGPGANILTCAEVAFQLREVLGKLRLHCFPKVSGSKGIQLYVPLNTDTSYNATQPFAKAVAELLARQKPQRIVAEMAKELRQGKVFIDWSQNAEHKTTVSPYSLRAKSEHPFVSLPVTWKELKTALEKNAPQDLYWEAAAALIRVKKKDDLFAPVLNLKQHLPAGFVSNPTAEPRPAPRRNALSSYSSKRDFSRSPEPAGARVPRRSAQGSRRRFVIQKHAASHLHYDFRLEMHDVLKSWAVPKGVPLRQGASVSAFATEDHPLAYLDFEGSIPQGQYGGGTVMVWDIGTYEIIDGNYWKGRLNLFLVGKKLHGEWNLQRHDQDKGKVRWLLTKTNGHAKPVSLRKENSSALTGRTLEQIAADKSAVWHSNRVAPVPQHHPRTESLPQVRQQPPQATPDLKFVPPMKAALTRKLPEGAEWIYEVKWDGYRALALKEGDTVRLLSLKNKNLTSDFPEVVNAVRSISARTALLDGEIVAVDNRGKPSFQVLQNRSSLGSEWHIVYYAFDLLNLEGRDLRRLPLVERRARLAKILARSQLRYSAELNGPPAAILQAVNAAGLEGIVAKRRDSVYRAGSSVETWLKLKLNKSQEFVIGGYKPEGNSFQSLLVGYYETDKLIFAGKVRQGFTPASRSQLARTMRPLIAKRCPFANLPTSTRSHFGEGITLEEMQKLVWLRPKLVAQCSFTEWTSYGLLRHASYLGMREDKAPHEVRKEV